MYYARGKAGNDRREFVAEGYKPAYQAAAFLKKSLAKNFNSLRLRAHGGRCLALVCSGKADNDHREFVVKGYKPAFQATAFLKKSLAKNFNSLRLRAHGGRCLALLDSGMKSPSYKDTF